jgi:ribonuclease P protein component
MLPMPDSPACDSAGADCGAPQDAPRRGRLRFSRRLRVLRQADFRRIMKEGLRAADSRLTLWALPSGLPHPRLGLTVGRQHGDAVRRNRIKRVLREAFRLLQHELPAGLDLVCAPRVGADIDRDACMAALRRLAEQLAGRMARRREGDAQ